MFKDRIGELKHETLLNLSKEIKRTGIISEEIKELKKGMTNEERTIFWLMVSGVKERNIVNNFKQFKPMYKVKKYLTENKIRGHLIESPFSRRDEITLALPKGIQNRFNKAVKQSTSSVFIDSKGRKRLINLSKDLGLANSFIIEEQEDGRLLAIGQLFNFYIG